MLERIKIWAVHLVFKLLRIPICKGCNLMAGTYEGIARALDDDGNCIDTQTLWFCEDCVRQTAAAAIDGGVECSIETDLPIRLAFNRYVDVWDMEEESDAERSED